MTGLLRPADATHNYAGGFSSAQVIVRIQPCWFTGWRENNNKQTNKKRAKLLVPAQVKDLFLKTTNVCAWGGGGGGLRETSKREHLTHRLDAAVDQNINNK